MGALSPLRMRWLPHDAGSCNTGRVIRWLRAHAPRPHVSAPLARLRLRTKVSMFFGLLALVASVSLSVVTYTITRSSLLDQRATTAKQQAIGNAARVLAVLRSQPAADEFRSAFANVDPEQGDGFNLVQRSDGELVGFDLRSLEAFPPELRAAVEDGQSGIQRFYFNGNYYIGAGVDLADVGAQYFEAFPLASTERNLQSLAIAFTVGSAVTVILASSIGVWTGRRLLRPLARITDAAGEIAAGDLRTRVARERDRDLEPLVESFNGMADAVQARIEREERFTSDVSHELRSPITALAAATDVLDGRRDELPERARQAVDVVVDQVRRFDGMVLDLLELSRIDAGASDLHLERVDLVSLTRRVAGRYGFAGLPVEVAGEVSSDNGCQATIDRIRFERILGNLLDNAKHHAEGPVRVVIEPAPHPYVDIVVEDAGPGIDEDERVRIFERFTRGKASRHRVGTGLGLALVSEHVQALGGMTWVEDRPGGGSRFVVRLVRGADDDSGATIGFAS